MLLVRGLLDRLLVVAAVVCGGLVPGFITQYQQRLGGRLDQARIDLEGWQKIADQMFHGDLYALIRYHAASTDPTFRAEAQVILRLVQTVQHLQEAVAALHGSLLQQMAYLSLHLDSGLARATAADWTPTFALSLEGIVLATLFGLVIWLVFHSIWWLLFRLGRPPVQMRTAARR